MEPGISRYFFLDDEKVIKGKDIVFSSREETLFGVFHLISGAKFTNQRTTFKEKAMNSLKIILEVLMIASITTDYMTLHSSKVESERVSFIDMSPFTLFSKWFGYSAVVTIFFILAFAILGQFFVLVFLMATFKSRNIQNRWLMRILRGQFNWMNGVLYPVVFKFLLALTGCETIRSEMDDFDFVCWGGDQIALAIGAVVLALIFFGVSFLGSYLMFDFNPTSCSLLTMAHGRVEIQALIIKTLIPLLFYIFHDPHTAYMTLFCMGIVIFQGGTYIVRLPHYSARINWLKAGLYGCLACLLGIASVFHLRVLLNDEFTHRTVTQIGFALMPFFFLFFSRMAGIRTAQFKEVFDEQAIQSNRIGDRFQWDCDNPDLMKNRSIKRLLSDLDTYILQKGVFATMFRRSFFCTDAELVSRPLQVTTLTQNSQFYKKMIFLSRLHFAREIEKNSEDAMVCAMYAILLWFYTKSINDTNNAMRAAMARKPTLDVKYMIYGIIRFCETYKQTYTAEGGDVVRTLEMRKNHEKVVKMHNDCLKKMRHMWKVLSKVETRTSKAATKIIKSCIEQVIKTQNAYSMILLKFPNARDVLLHFSIFRRDILQDEHGSKLLLSRARNLDAGSGGDTRSLDQQSSNGSSSILDSNASTDVFQLMSASNRKYLQDEMINFSSLKKKIISFSFIFACMCIIGLIVTRVRLTVVKESIDNVMVTGSLMVAVSNMGIRMAGMDYFARNSNAESFKIRNDQFLGATESLKETSFEIFDTAKKNDVSEVVELYEKNSIDMLLPSSTGVFRNEKVNFHSMTTNIISSGRSIAGLSMEDFLKRDGTQNWQILHENLVTVIPEASRHLLNEQISATTSTVDETEQTIFGANGIVVLLCLFLTIHSAIKMSRAFGLFSQKLPSYVFLCQDLSPLEVRKVYQQRCSQKTEILTSNAFERKNQEMMDEEEDLRFCDEEDNLNGEMGHENHLQQAQDVEIDEDTGNLSNSQESDAYSGIDDPDSKENELDPVLTHKNTAFSLSSSFISTEDNPIPTTPQLKPSVAIITDGKPDSASQHSSGSSNHQLRSRVESKMADPDSSPNFGVAFTNVEENNKSPLKPGMSIRNGKGKGKMNFNSKAASTRSLGSKGSLPEDENSLKLKNMSILRSLTSRYAWKLLLTLFLSVFAFLVMNVYFLRAQLQDFNSLNKEFRSAVLVGHYVDMGVVNILEICAGNDVFLSKDNAKTQNIKDVEMTMAHWNCLMYGDCDELLAVDEKSFDLPGAAFRNNDRETLLFQPGCLLASGTCADDRYYMSSASGHGLNELMFRAASANGELISISDTIAIGTDFMDVPVAQFIIYSGITDIKDGLQTMVAQFKDEKDDLETTEDNLFWSLGVGSLLYSVFVYFITWAVLFRSIRQEMKLTYFFLSVMPPKLMQTSRFIQTHCISSGDSNDDL